jgi:beta-ketodecanoyl-[acyl-carrier-protein] synthase
LQPIAITGTGLYTPPETISNDELVASFNAYVGEWNEAHGTEIEAGAIEALQTSSSDFILAASGIKSRKVMDKSGVLDPGRMVPRLRERANDEPSLLAEMSVAAASEALAAAGRRGEEVDCVLVACSNLERPYPAIAIEVQQLLGARGFGYDLNVACSSATFGMQAAADALRSSNANLALVVNPEVCTGHLNFRDRDSHFIFGDACTAVVLERAAERSTDGAFEILGTKLVTQFSNNIRNNFGFLNPTHPESRDAADKLFVQSGRKVFREVVPLVAALIVEHLTELGLEPAQLRRMWLHQANLAMNQLIARRVLGHDPDEKDSPTILDEWANTSSAGSIIAFHLHRDGLVPGDLGLICSFGAGYSAGSVVVRAL